MVGLLIYFFLYGICWHEFCFSSAWILECIYPCSSYRQQQQPKQSTLRRPEYNMPRWPPQKLDAVRDPDHLKCTLVSDQCRELATDFGYKQRNFACLKMCLLFHTRDRHAKKCFETKTKYFLVFRFRKNWNEVTVVFFLTKTYCSEIYLETTKFRRR